MLIDFLFELMTYGLMGAFILLPAVAVNRRSADAVNKLSLEEKRQRINREVDELVNWYHSQLSRSDTLSIGAAYVRSSTADPERIVDQFRRIFEQAIELRVFIPREFVFFDLRAIVRKKRWSGFIDLENLLRDKKVQTLMLFETNGSTFRTIEFVHRVQKLWGIRVVFVAQGLDTNLTKKWELILSIHAMMDQFIVTRRRGNHSRPS